MHIQYCYYTYYHATIFSASSTSLLSPSYHFYHIYLFCLLSTV